MIIVDLGDGVYMDPDAITLVVRVVDREGVHLDMYRGEGEMPVSLREGGVAYDNLRRFLDHGVSDHLRFVRMSEGDNA